MHALFKIPGLLQNTISRITTTPRVIIRCFFHSSPDVYAKLLETYIHTQSLNPARVLQAGKALHAHLIVTRSASFPNIASKLISFYGKYEKISEARHLFDEIPQRNISHWVVFIGACCRKGYYKEALNVFFEMRREGLGPDRFVIPSILRACAQLGDHRTGGCVHGLILKWCLEDDAFVNCGLVDMYSKCGRIDKASEVFDMVVEKDLAVFNAMVSGYAQNGFASEGLKLVENMKTEWGVKPDIVTWNSLLAGFSQEGNKSMVSEILELMREDETEPDVTSWTSIISGYVQIFQNEDAFGTFKETLSSGVEPNSATISSLLPACATLANVRYGKEIHGYAVVIGVERDVFVASSLVDTYAKCGFISEAKALFRKMPERNTVSWNSMIFGLANHGYCDEAIDTFLQMEKEAAQRIDHLTFTAALTACSHGGMTELGESLLSKMQEKYGIIPRLEHYACLVDLLGRAGKLVEAYDLIKKMPMEPDLFVWGALLGACRIHGDIELAQIACQQLVKLEPKSPSSTLSLSGLYADAGSWSSVTKLKGALKRSNMTKFLGCSWIEEAV